MSGSKDTSAEQLIERAGGSAALSRLTGYSVQRINNWKQRGIPAAAKVRFPHLFWPDRELGEQQVAPGSSSDSAPTEGQMSRQAA